MSFTTRLAAVSRFLFTRYDKEAVIGRACILGGASGVWFGTEFTVDMIDFELDIHKKDNKKFHREDRLSVHESLSIAIKSLIFGALVGGAHAVPIGILCGINPIFYAGVLGYMKFAYSRMWA